LKYRQKVAAMQVGFCPECGKETKKVAYGEFTRENTLIFCLYMKKEQKIAI